MLSRSELTETYLLHTFSSGSFTKHCTLSYPTAELLDALWSLDTFSFWTHFFEKASSGWLGFVTWLKNNVSMPSLYTAAVMQIWFIIQGSTKEGQDLYSHYMHGWDLYIQHSLTHLSLGPLDSQLIIFLILQPFDESLTEALNGPQHPLLSKLSRLFYDKDFRRTSLLTEFFSDPSRSGPFCLEGDEYAIFTINFAKYLITEMYVCESVKYTSTFRS